MQRRDFLKSALGAGALLGCRKAFSWQTENPQAEPNPNVKRVLAMFKCHFDAGFIDTQANVIRRYFTDYFPQAIKVANQMGIGPASICLDHWLVVALRVSRTGIERRSQTYGRGNCPG